MDDVDDWQRRLVAQARRERRVPDDARARILTGLRRRVADPTDEPAWRMPAPRGRPRRSWALTIGVGLAAAALLAALLHPNAGVRTRDVAPQQAIHAEDDVDSAMERTQARDHGPRGERPAAAPVDDADPPPPTEDPPPADDTVPRTEPSVPVDPPAPARASTHRDRAPSDAPPADALSIADETELLRAAQKALAEGRLSAAARGVADYRRRFPSGVLRSEADGLSVIVDCRRGVPGSERRAARHAKRYPGSVMLPRIERACARQREQ